jgi:hypothetical protein
MMIDGTMDIYEKASIPRVSQQSQNYMSLYLTVSDPTDQNAFWAVLR